MITKEAADRARWLARPHYAIRIAAIFFSLLLACVPIVTVYFGFLRFREVAPTSPTSRKASTPV